MSQEPKCKKIKSKPIFLNFPILYIDVKIDDAKTVRLPIFNGDNSENLATKFAIDHSKIYIKYIKIQITLQKKD